MGDEPIDDLETVVMDYVERYGLTEKARRYFFGRSVEEKEQARAQPCAAPIEAQKAIRTEGGRAFVDGE